jgi:UDP-glucose 4-epimerase
MTPQIDVAPMSGPGRAAVIGATGLVGSALARQLLDDGWEVTATVRDAGSAEWVADALRGAQVATLANLLDGEAVGALLRECRPRVVFNCVGVLSGSGPGAARAYGDGNVTAVAVILDACARSEVGRAIVLGSGFEYAPASSPLHEGSPIGPTTLYGATKAAASVVARYFANIACLDVCVARPFSLYGPRERLSRFVPHVITSALAGQAIEMSTGTQTRDYLYVGDLVDGLVRLARHDGPLLETVNFAGPSEHSLLDVALIAIETADSRAPLRTGARPENPGDRPIFLGDSRLAREMLGWRPAHDLRSGLAKTVDWYRAHRNLWETPA